MRPQYSATHCTRDKMMRLNGPLGMGDAPVNSLYTYELHGSGDETLLKLNHQTYGILSADARADHEKGWWLLLGDRLKAYVDSRPMLRKAKCLRPCVSRQVTGAKWPDRAKSGLAAPPGPQLGEIRQTLADVLQDRVTSDPSTAQSHPEVRIPPADSDSLYCTLYRRTPGFVALAEAELEALAGGAAAEAGIWLSSKPIQWSQTGYGTGGGRQLAAAQHLDELRDQLLALDLVAPRIGITARRIPRDVKGASVAKVLVADCIDGDVDFANPQLRLLLVISPWGYRVVQEMPGDQDWLRSRHKPHPFAVALPVRMAKAMLNLTVRPGDTVLDPFCGSGTIVLLASWAGHPAFGSDISATSVHFAAANSAYFGQHPTLVHAKAQDAKQHADCIVTNPPYGLYSHVEGGAMSDVLANLRRLAPRVTLVSSERLLEPLQAHGYTVTRVISAGTASFERFIYLTLAKSI